MKKILLTFLGTLALINSSFAGSKAELHITATVVQKCEFINGRAVCGNDSIKQAKQQIQSPSPMFVDAEEVKEAEVFFNENTTTLQDNLSEVIVKSYEF